ncbi:MAG: DUF6428 family protein [Spartobacteria bacterium]
MKSSAFVASLKQNPTRHLRFVLPDGGIVPPHAHITEVGRVDKTFFDCGATFRKTSFLCLQAWVADDTDHRLPAGKLADIIDRAAPLFQGDDLEVELEYEDGLISQFPVESLSVDGESVVVFLFTKHTDCLAKDICLAPALESKGCCSGSGCC